MLRFGLIALVVLASPAFAQSYGQSQYQQGPAPYPGTVQPYPGQTAPSYGSPYPGKAQPYPGQAPTYGQAPYGYNAAPPQPVPPPSGYEPQQPRGYNQAPRTYGGERYGGPPGFTCDASFPFQGLQQTLICPLGQPRPTGAPCSCPPPAGFPVGGRMPGHVVQ